MAMMGGSRRYRSTGNLPSSKPSGTPMPIARANPIANSERLTETSWRKPLVRTISKPARMTRVGWLVYVASTMPTRGAISQTDRNAITMMLETSVR